MLGITNTEFSGRNWGNYRDLGIWMKACYGVNRAPAREGRSPYFKNAR